MKRSKSICTRDTIPLCACGKPAQVTGEWFENEGVYYNTYRKVSDRVAKYLNYTKGDPLCDKCKKMSSEIAKVEEAIPVEFDTIAEFEAYNRYQKFKECTLEEYRNRSDEDRDLYDQFLHPYRRFRKDYCENVDSRLGFKCTTNVIWNGMLDVDHIDGNPSNNDETNLQTLCKCCHAYKTNVNKDYLTEGRKSLGLSY